MAIEDKKVKEYVEIFFSGRELRKSSGFLQSGHYNLFAAVYCRHNNNQEELLGYTDCIHDDANPDWVQQFKIWYRFNENQYLIARIFDKQTENDLNEDFHRHTYFGEATFLLANVLKSKGQKADESLSKGAISNGAITIRVESSFDINEEIIFDVACKDLANKDGSFFGVSDPFLLISRLREDNSLQPIYKSSVIKNELSPAWHAIRISMQLLCNGDIERPLRFDIIDNGSKKSMGYIKTTVSKIQDNVGKFIKVLGAKGTIQFGTLGFDKLSQKIVEEIKSPDESMSSLNSSLAKELHLQTPGHLDGVVPCDEMTRRFQRRQSFLNYILGGCEISFVVAIDFTSSNGSDINDPSSLHFIDPQNQTLNIYESTIQSVGAILEPYDYDKVYPVYGYGAQLKSDDGTFSKVQHKFLLHDNSEGVKGVKEILTAYRSKLPLLKFGGPTLFEPCIDDIIQKVPKCTQDKQRYTILLIITDGAIGDMEETVEKIVQASELPMSIIIAGVGEEDFSDMKFLDSDGVALTSEISGNKAVRDIVQFIPYNEYKDKNVEELAAQVLEEIPEQFLSFMEMNSINPLPPCVFQALDDYEYDD